MSIPRQARADLAFAVTIVRQARGMSKQGLADVIEMPRQQIQRVENGTHDPGIVLVYRLAKGLKVSARTLVCIAEARRSDNATLVPIIGISDSHLQTNNSRNKSTEGSAQ